MEKGEERVAASVGGAAGMSPLTCAPSWFTTVPIPSVAAGPGAGAGALKSSARILRSSSKSGKQRAMMSWGVPRLWDVWVCGQGGSAMERSKQAHGGRRVE